MALIPQSVVGRAIAIVWIVACVGMLIFAWVQQSIHDMPVAFIWLMIFLTFPIGYAVALIVGILSSTFPGTGTYHPFWDVVPMWIALTVAGYAQWFVLLPAAWRRVRGKNRAI